VPGGESQGSIFRLLPERNRNAVAGSSIAVV